MQLPVKNSRNEVVFISADEVLYLIREGRDIFVHTSKTRYSIINSLNDFEALLQPSGFEKLDKSNLVNMEKVMKWSSVENKAYFDKEDKSIKVHVSRRNQEKLAGYPEL
ncbi:LytTR family DNA-binding domain-containing protein [Alkalihalobacillus sp. FSL R5-0424]